MGLKGADGAVTPFLTTIPKLYKVASLVTVNISDNPNVFSVSVAIAVLPIVTYSA